MAVPGTAAYDIVALCGHPSPPPTPGSLIMSQFPPSRVVGFSSHAHLSRRGFLKAAGAATVLAAARPAPTIAAAEPAAAKPASESLVKLFYDSLTAEQKEQV